MVSGPSELRPIFTVSLDGVAIDHEKVKGAVACVQDFVRHPLCTQRNFSSDTGISMSNTAVTAAVVFRHSSEFDPWGAIRVEADPVIADHESCREKVVPQRKAVKDTWERWFGEETVESSAVGEAAPRTAVRISDVVEVGDVQYVEENNKLGLPCCSRSESNPGKSKKRRVPVCPVIAEKNISLLKVRLLAVFQLKLLLRKVFRNWAHEKVVVITVRSQFSRRDININLIVYM